MLKINVKKANCQQFAFLSINLYFDIAQSFSIGILLS
jgi:hypothetical protein